MYYYYPYKIGKKKGKSNMHVVSCFLYFPFPSQEEGGGGDIIRMFFFKLFLFLAQEKFWKKSAELLLARSSK